MFLLLVVSGTGRGLKRTEVEDVTEGGLGRFRVINLRNTERGDRTDDKYGEHGRSRIAREKLWHLETALDRPTGAPLAMANWARRVLTSWIRAKNTVRHTMMKASAEIDGLMP